jgi:hypothetical protein
VDAKAADLTLDHLQNHNPVSDLLGWDLYSNGLVSLILVSLFQRCSRMFDVLSGPARAQVRINGLLYLQRGQLVGSFNPILLNIDLPLIP